MEELNSNLEVHHAQPAHLLALGRNASLTFAEMIAPLLTSETIKIKACIGLDNQIFFSVNMFIFSYPSVLTCFGAQKNRLK